MSDRDAYADMVLSQVDRDRPFEPQTYYDPDGDCIEFLMSDDPFYAERIDSLVTVYYSNETDEVIGSLIKGVRQFIQKFIEMVPGFKIEIEDGRIRLEHLFTAHLWYLQEGSRSGEVVLVYKKLRDAAERVDAAVELCPA